MNFSGPFTILLAGRFSKEDVRVLWNPDARKLPPGLRDGIDAYWAGTILNTPKSRFIFNGALCRLNSYRVQGGTLHLELGLTDYKELLFSNSHAEEIITEHGGDLLSGALGVSLVLLSKEQQVILIRRSDDVGECPDKLDVVGGHIEPGEHSVAGNPDPFIAIKAELLEENGPVLGRDEPTFCIGLIETTDTRKPELIFQAQSRRSAQEIIDLGQRTSAPEIADFETVHEDHLAEFLEKNAEEFSPSALGVLSVFKMVAT